MFRTIADVRSAWDNEAKATLKVLDALPDHALDFAVIDGHRSLGRMAWHLVESLIEMPARMGLEIDGRELISEGGFICDPPEAAAEIRDAYARASESLLANLDGWTDADLEIEDDMYGESWKRGMSFLVLITHQVHHRGQMTVLMRQADLPVPSIYGPTKEGWAAYGMEAPRV